MIECQKKYGSKWRSNLEAYLIEENYIEPDTQLQFILSPNDLVYLPTKDNPQGETIDKRRIYKFIDPNDNKGNFVPYSLANVLFSVKFADQKKIGIAFPIQDEIGLGSQHSKSPRAITGEMIKEVCIPIKVDRLGHVIELNGVNIAEGY